MDILVQKLMGVNILLSLSEPTNRVKRKIMLLAVSEFHRKEM